MKRGKWMWAARDSKATSVEFYHSKPRAQGEGGEVYFCGPTGWVACGTQVYIFTGLKLKQGELRRVRFHVEVMEPKRRGGKR